MRPEILTDLPESTRRGDEILSIQTAKLPPRGALFSAVGTLLAAAEKLDVTTETSYGTVRMYLTPTDADLEEALRAAQEEWDRRRDQYEAAQVSGTKPEGYVSTLVEQWARKEGRPWPWLGDV